MLKRMLLLMCVIAVCAVGSTYPAGVVPTCAARVAPSNDALHDLLLATTHAKMSGHLRGKLLRILNSARRSLAAGILEEAGAELDAYLALLQGQSGIDISADVADRLIAAVDSAAASLFAYLFAADYDRVPIVATGPTSATSVNWRTKGVVTGVQNQGQCQADYAFSATGAAEGAWGIKKGQLVDLSEQRLIDCDTANSGCQGGSPVRALEYSITHGGFVTASSYPYTARDGTCKTATPVVTISSLSRPQPGDEEALKTFVASKGPVSVVLRIRGSAWDNYSGGIFEPGQGDSGVPRYEAALIVGFGEQAGTPYWIVKASKGTGWGDQGYVLVILGQNALGIADYVVLPIV